MKTKFTFSFTYGCIIYLCCFLISLSANASVKIDNLYYNLSGEEAALTYQNYQSSPDYDSLTEVEVPASVEYQGVFYRVTSIDEYAFYRCSNLKSVIIPESISSIGNWSFYYCDNLESLVLNEGLNSIGEWSFAWCKKLNNLELPETLTSIGRSGFYGCSSLTSVSIPESIEDLGNYIFGFCSSLAVVNLPSSLASLGDYCFYQCNALSQIDLPKYLRALGENCFEMCNALSEINIPEGVTVLNKGCFNGCSSLASVSIPSTVASIDDDAFGSTGLTNIYCYAEFPPALTSDSFYLSYSATLHVPHGSKKDYQESEYWSNFSDIIEDLEKVTGVNFIEQDSRVPAGKTLVYDLNGRIISASQPSELNNLKRGLYIINGHKVMVK